MQSRELFKANARYEGKKTPRGVLLVELVEMTTPQARLVRRQGQTLLESSQTFTQEDVARALESFP